MKYRIKWTKSALDELAVTWMEADSVLRELIVASTRIIESELADDPFKSSESRPGGRRIQFVFPPGVRFFVKNDETVVITQVWCFVDRRRR